VTTGVKDSSGNTLSSQWTTTSGFTPSRLFVTVAGGALYTSADAITWNCVKTGSSTQCQGGSNYYLKSITSGEGIFVAVGYSSPNASDVGTIITSPDGSTWTTRVSNVSNLGGVTYGNGQFIAVGGDGYILTSDDGITWNPQNSGTTLCIKDVAYGNNLFVAVTNTASSSECSYGGGFSGAKILTSSGGTTWNQTSGNYPGFSRVRYVNNLFIAVSSNDMSSRKIVTSSDGENWTTRVTGSGDINTDVAYGNGIYVLTAWSAAIATSSDSINWTSGNISGYTSITFASNKFVAVGTNGKLAISNDGVNWVQYTHDSSPRTPLWGHHESITYGPVQ